MINVLSEDSIKKVLRTATAPCISVYLPTHRVSTQSAEDAIRLENLLKDGRHQLEELGHDGRRIDELLTPARALLDDHDFWAAQSDGLAILAWPGGQVVHRLPLAFEELCVAGSRPHIKPLLPMLGGDGRFFVLAISQKAVRLFQGSRSGLRPLDLHDIPSSLAEVVGYDVEQKALQFRTLGPSGGGGGMRGAAFHGHGAGADDRKDEIEKFLRAVDDGVCKLMHGQRVPVVLAAAEPVASMYRRLSKHPDLLREGPSGNFDGDDRRILFDRAWPHVAPRFDAARRRLVDLVREGLGTGKAVQRIEEVLAAARDGRVEAMLVAVDGHRWGTIADKVEVHPKRRPGDVDLIDVAAAECLLHGGTVHAMTAEAMPGDGAVVAAVLRF